MSKLDKRIDRRTFVKAATAGSLAAASLPFLGIKALAEEDDESRIFVFVSFGKAPAGQGLTEPRIGVAGAGTFWPADMRVSGGGSYALFDQAASIPKPLIASGRWSAQESSATPPKGCPPTGRSSPGSSW